VITAVLTSDNHLGAYSARYRPEKLELRRKTLCKAFACVVDSAIERKADLFLHAGDLFDRPDPRNEERQFVASELCRLRNAGIPVFAIAGNHDTPKSWGYGGGYTPQQEAHELGGLHLFRETDTLKFVDVEIRGQKIRVSGMSSDFNLDGGSCPLDKITMETHDSTIPHVVLLHYGIEGWMYAGDTDLPEPMLSLENLERLPASVIGVGHLHRRNRKTLASGALLINPGSTERMNFGEEGLTCSYTWLEFEKAQVSANWEDVLMQPMRTLKREMTTNNPQSLQTGQVNAAAAELFESCLTEINAAANGEMLMRVQFSGQMSRGMDQAFEWEKLQTQASSACFHCLFDRESLTVYDPDSDLPLGYGVSFDVREELGISAARLQTTTEDATDKEINSAALSRLLEAYDSLKEGAKA